MARDKITVDLILATKQADREVARINKNIEKLGKTMGRSFGGASGGGDKVRALGSGLSKATVKADEFSKSMEASNARVIAFGASAGLIMGVDRALKAMVSSAIKVEKAMMDVNVVMGVSNRQLDQFGKGMFRVAKDTAQSFETVAEAATELARQGLGMEKTLSRTKDALILTRLTGMNAADAVKSLTAAVNSFNKEGVTSTQIVNRMAKVDAAYAVSSEDLAKSISRVGASAISAGVNLNELMAITTAVQQKTARGGAVIGNAFKTIFTRIQRSSVQKKLKDFGIASRDMQGNMLGGIKVLQNMADQFDNLTKSQQASLAENVAGVFQVNILKSALSDLSSQTSHYTGALKTANAATNEAYQRNEQLNQTLDALANRTVANLTKAGASLGGATLEPGIRKILNSVNSVIDAFSEGGQFENFGKTIGKGLLAGIGNFISGPGLLIATAVFAKLSLSLGKFAGTAFKDIMGLNNATKQRVALEEAVIAHIAAQPALLTQVKSGTLNVLTVEQDILATVRLANMERAKIQAYAAPLTGALMGRGVRTGKFGATIGRPGGAGGFIPNFASPGGERAAAAAGGYRAGSIKTMQQPGAGTMMYNSAETVKRFPGMSQSAIMPPQGSPAGAGYKAAFGGAHGFNPYAGSGFVPNFGRPAGPASPFAQKASWGAGTTNQSGKSKAAQRKANRYTYDVDADDIGVLLGFGVGTAGSVTQKPFAAEAKGLLGLKKWPTLHKQLSEEGARVRLNHVKIRSFKSGKSAKSAEIEFADEIQRNIKGGLSSLASNMMGQLGIEGAPGRVGVINEAFQGEVFEESMRMAMKAAEALPGAAFDFEANRPPRPTMAKIFGRPISRIDAKRRIESAAGAQHGIPKKYFNDAGMAPIGVQQIVSQRAALFKEFGMGGGQRPLGKKGEWAGPFQKMAKGPGRAAGFVPNFSPLSSALGRELQAGVPASAIRVGSSPSLRSAGNPGGVGVYNTVHEPGGLQQGISRSRSQGINPRSHGVPNFQILDQFGFPAGSSTPAGGGMPSGGRTLGPHLNLSEITIKGGDDWDAGTKKFVKGSKALEASAMKQQRAANAMMMASIAISMAGPSIGSALGGGTPSGEAAGAGIANMLSMGVMGAATGAMMGGGVLSLPGALIGGAAGLGMGALSMDWSGAFGEEGEKNDAQQVLDQAKAVSEGIGAINKALEEMANLDYMTIGQRMLKFAKLQEKFLQAENLLLGGGEETAGIMKDFRANKDIQALKAGDFSKLSPDAFKGAESALQLTMEKAKAVTTSGSQSAFEGHMDRSWTQYGEVRKLELAVEKMSAPGYKPPRSSLYPDLGSAQTALADARVEQAGIIGDTFTGDIQKRMATGKVRGRYGEVSGESIIKNFQANAEKGDVRAALSPQFLQLMRESGAEKAADSLEQMIGPEGSDPGFWGATLPELIKGKKAYTDDELGRMAQGERLRTNEYSPGAAVFQMLQTGMKTGQLGMFQDMYGPQKGQLTDDEKAALQEEQRKGIRKFQTPIDEARKTGRDAGYAMISGKADRRREMAGTGADRQNRKRLNAVTMFGDNLIDAGKAIEYEKIEEGKRLKDEDIEETRKQKRTQLLAKSEEKYLTAIRGADIGIDQRASAEDDFADFRKTLEKKNGVSLLKEQRNDLQEKGKQRTTVEEKQLSALNEIINAEITTREKSDHSLKENNEELINNVKIVDKNTEAQKKLLEATKKFYSGKHLDNLRTEKSILQGKITFQKKEMEEGRIHSSVLQKSTSRMRTLNNELGVTANAFDDFYRKPMEEQRDQLKEQIKWEKGEVAARRMSIAALEETQVELEKLNQQIDGTGDAFGSLMAQARRVMGKGLDPGERRASEEAAAQEFRDLMRGRRGGDSLGTQRVLGTGGPKDAFKQGLITADEYRDLRKTARLGKGGDPGEAFSDQFMYGGRDAMLEMEAGVTNVAQNMKSSFADAFQSIASGADSVKGALASMAQSMLNSISQVSTNMFTNALFSRMGNNSQGGLIPGYQGGGVVTGGSGYKDDVFSRMQGGEFVIKKSSAQKIGYDKLNAINMEGGGAVSNKEMGKMGLIAAGASAASGLIGSLTQDKPDKPLPMRDYGYGRGKYGFFGGPDRDAGQVDSIGGGGGRAAVSLSKGYVYYRRDPETGRLISEKARPTEGRFEVSSSLSLMGRLGDDPQTSRMFDKEQNMSKYLDYLETETRSRKAQVDAAKKKKKMALVQGYVNAAMMIGGSYMMGKTAPSTTGMDSPTAMSDLFGMGDELSAIGSRAAQSSVQPSWSGPGGVWGPNVGNPNPNFGDGKGGALGGYIPRYENGGGVPAMLMGGEYVMSPETVRSYGTSFMGELNRGNVPGGMANGGPVVGNQGIARTDLEPVAAPNTTNNVKISVNIDKRGKTEASTEASQGTSDEASNEKDEVNEVENNKALGELLQSAVLDEIVKQQRPGGLLQRNSPYSP